MKRQLKMRRKRKPKDFLQSEICNFFHLSLSTVHSVIGFTSYMLLCTEWARLYWPGPNKIGFAMTGLSTECVNKNNSPLKALNIKILLFTEYFTKKETSTFYRSWCLLCERTICGKQIKNSALLLCWCQVTSTYICLDETRNPYSGSVQFSLSLFKASSTQGEFWTDFFFF